VFCILHLIYIFCSSHIYGNSAVLKPQLKNVGWVLLVSRILPSYCSSSCSSSCCCSDDWLCYRMDEKISIRITHMTWHSQQKQKMFFAFSKESQNTKLCLLRTNVHVCCFYLFLSNTTANINTTIPSTHEIIFLIQKIFLR